MPSAAVAATVSPVIRAIRPAESAAVAAAARQVGRAERGGMVGQPPPQRGLHPGHRPMCRQLGQPGHERPPERDGHQTEQRPRQVVRVLLERRHHDLGDEACLGHEQGSAHPAEDHGSGEEGAGGAGVRRQPGIDRSHDQ
ncbi:hypothetical protein CG723_13395 [Streptomyces sp. CB01635]|uniref:hypothetical protein n=1 Tax=Streptomyces sp. CB01635 TaxID=2020326 RepID=UPI000C270651|nr:hypothetical protein CG723_13395 [Streptomyces sp. CB01635]